MSRIVGGGIEFSGQADRAIFVGAKEIPGEAASGRNSHQHRTIAGFMVSKYTQGTMRNSCDWCWVAFSVR
jgi:hypothetical protein